MPLATGPPRVALSGPGSGLPAVRQWSARPIVAPDRHTESVVDDFEDPGSPSEAARHAARAAASDAQQAAAAESALIAFHTLGQNLATVAAEISHSAERLEQIRKTLLRWRDLDLSRVGSFDRWAPDNLRGLEIRYAKAAFALSLDEGLPLSWVPRAEIVVLLAEADNAAARLEILNVHQDDILDDCEAVLSPITAEWATQCRSAIKALLRSGLVGPAQSHAANIVDSIVLALGSSNQRQEAVELARRDPDSISLVVAGTFLALRPLAHAYVRWYPGGDDPFPKHFARHPTVHAVGHTGLFDPTYALVGVMLAISLTVQFHSEFDTQDN